MGKPTLRDIRELAAQIEKERAGILERQGYVKVLNENLEKMILLYSSLKQPKVDLSEKEYECLSQIEQTGKRDYVILTAILFGENTEENRKAAYKVFDRWKRDELIWKTPEGVWVVSEDVFLENRENEEE